MPYGAVFLVQNAQDPAPMQFAVLPAPPATDPVRHPSLLKPEHQQSKAQRRGPMDEMRQLLVGG